MSESMDAQQGLGNSGIRWREPQCGWNENGNGVVEELENLGLDNYRQENPEDFEWLGRKLNGLDAAPQQVAAELESPGGQYSPGAAEALAAVEYALENVDFQDLESMHPGAKTFYQQALLVYGDFSRG